MVDRKRHELKLKSLASQIQYYAAVEYHHKMWADDLSDNEIERLHLEVSELLRQAREKSIALLDKYNHNHV